MAMQSSPRSSDRPVSREAQILRRLVSVRVFGPYAFFFVTGEGSFFPNGVEDSSGYVLDRRGQVWSFLTGWDADRQEVTLVEWELTAPEADWIEDEEFQEARSALGLT